MVKGAKIATVLPPDMVGCGRQDSNHAEILFNLVGTGYRDVFEDDQIKGVRMGNREFGLIFSPFLNPGLAGGLLVQGPCLANGSW